MKKKSLKELGRANIAEFKKQKKTPIVLILDNVRSALNVGSAFRTADAFALEKIYLCGITATPPHREILKTAIGATQSMAWEYQKETTSIVQQLQNENYKVLAIEQTDSSCFLQDFELKTSKKIALIFGNEVKGVSDEVLSLIDGCLEVPQFGTKHSLNVSVCIGIVVWDIFKKLQQ